MPRLPRVAIVCAGVWAVPSLSELHRGSRFGSSVQKCGCDLGEHGEVICAQQSIRKPEHHHFEWSVGLVRLFAPWVAHGVWVATSAE